MNVDDLQSSDPAGSDSGFGGGTSESGGTSGIPFAGATVVTPEPEPDPEPEPTNDPADTGGASTTDYDAGTVDDIQTGGDPTDEMGNSGMGSGTSRSGDNSGSGGDSGSGVEDGVGGDPADVSPDVEPGPTTTPAPGVTNNPTESDEPDGGMLALALAAVVVVVGGVGVALGVT